MFKVGDEVVCVDDANPTGIGYAPVFGIVKGVVYTVSSVGVWPGDGFSPVVFLAETANDQNARLLDCGYAPDRFRKVERKTDKLSLTEWLSQPSGNTERLDKSKRSHVNG